MSSKYARRYQKKMIKFYPKQSVRDNFKEGSHVCIIGFDRTYRDGYVESITSRRKRITDSTFTLYFKIKLSSGNNYIEVTGDNIIKYMPKWLWKLKMRFPFLITKKDFS